MAADDERENEQRDDLAERRARARRNAIVLGLLVAAIYVGYILLGLVRGIFPA